MIRAGLSRRDRQLIARAQRDLEAFEKIAELLPAAIEAAKRDAVGIPARRYDGALVRSGGTTGDPTARAALRSDPVRDRLDLVLRNLNTMHRAAVAAGAAVEALGGFDDGE